MFFKALDETSNIEILFKFLKYICGLVNVDVVHINSC